MNWPTLLVLGFAAGATILIGLPAGRLRGFGATPRAALSMLAAGIILFLLVEILGQACGTTAAALRQAWSAGPAAPAAALLALLLAGFFAGLVGLVALEQKLMRCEQAPDPQRLSLMISVGIGLHNLSEGLAIGQAYAQKMLGMTTSLIIGFALHNATEGFGIVGPMVKSERRPSWGMIMLFAAIGGGPTFIGTLLGSLWTSPALSVFVLAAAGGSLLYVLKELLAGIRRERAQIMLASALAAGFILGWGTEVIADASQGGGQAGQSADPDGDRVSASALQAGPAVSAAENAAQDRASNDVLHEKALKPKVMPDGTREYRLTASVFPWQLYPGARIDAWGYNHQVPGPLIRLRVGEKVRFVFENQLPQPSTIHWHGLAVPNRQDGVPGATQDAVPPGGRYVYEFVVTPQMIGTHLYHTHVNDDFQMDKGLHGVLVVDPATGPSARYDARAIYDIASFKVGSEQENVFTLNGKAYPEAPALRVRQGERVLIRLVNSSAEESHVMHLHGYTFRVVALDGNSVANPAAVNSVLLAPSQTADIAFTADNPGEWMFHCHILDHAINPGPAGDGSETQMAEMGGLMTFVDVVPKGASIDSDYVSAGAFSNDATSMAGRKMAP